MVAINSDRFDTSLSCPCRECGRTYIVDVKMDDYLDWINGKGLIQDIFPYLSAGERELLISGICGECFDRIFGVDN